MIPYDIIYNKPNLLQQYTDFEFQDVLNDIKTIPEEAQVGSHNEKIFTSVAEMIAVETFYRLGAASAHWIKKNSDEPDGIIYFSNFSFVFDCKTKRISSNRLQYNNYKIDSISNWQKKYGTTYGMVLVPLWDLPTKNSQVYKSAHDKNITLFTWEWLEFLFENKENIKNIKSLFTVIQNTNTPAYKNMMENKISGCCGTSILQLEYFLDQKQYQLRKRAYIEIKKCLLHDELGKATRIQKRMNW